MRFINWLRKKWESNQEETRRSYEEFVNGESLFFRRKPNE